MRESDVIIIGAGLLGCFTARNLMRYNIGVTVIEQENDVCRGVSRANTGIIYAGYDNKPGSLKSKLCVKANSGFGHLCSELGVPFSRPGSLMVAYGAEADAVIRKKYSNGLESGVPGMRMLSGSEAEAMEPALAKGITSALYSETTGTVDPWDLCIATYENAQSNGTRFIFNTAVTDVQRVNDGGFIVTASDEAWHAKAVINAAGLYADKIRELTEEPLIRIYPEAADYMILDKPRSVSDGTVKHIIFHETEEGKGLTVVPTVDGSILLGPTNRDLPEEARIDHSLKTEGSGLKDLEKLCEDMLPGLDLSERIRTFGSIRQRPYYVSKQDGEYVRNAKSINDICILEESGLISLIGIRTPGMTIADELGHMIADKAAEAAGCTEINAGFDPRRKEIVRARDLSPEERADLIERDPEYGEVVCFCMDVTKAEIRQAIERGACDFESVKRRTGAGLGKCQGSRCRRCIADILTQHST
jgi:glycerol-3-phosphate dehydrogenase